MSEAVRRSRRRTSLLIGALGVLMVVGYGADAVNLLYPDLVSDWGEHDTYDSPFDTAQVTDPLEIDYNGANLLVVRFDGFVTNIGEGPLRIAGDPQTDSVYQYFLKEGGSPTNLADYLPGESPVTVVYETDDGHNHWHLKNAQQYALWNEDKTVQVTPGAKVGFCLYDIDQISADADGKFYGGERVQFCDRDDPDATEIEMGVSVGWKDVYKKSVSQQWVDVSNVAPGVYYLSSKTDTSDQIEESDETNNGIAFHPDPVVISGYLPTDLSVGTQYGGAVSFDLPADTHGMPGPAAYTITDGPDDGTASVDPNTGAVTYQPADGFVGTDSFEFTVHDGTSDYPRQRPSAAVTVEVAEPAPAPEPAPSGGGGGGGIALPPPPEEDAILLLEQTCPDSLTDPGFTDLDGLSQEAREAVTCLVGYGITQGTAETTFSPQVEVNRWQMALFLVRQYTAHGESLPPVDDHGFEDIGDLPASTQDAINRLATLGVTVGTSSTTFDPGMPVTRWQMALFLTRVAGLVGIALDETPPSPFTDLGGLSLEAQLGIDQLAAAEIVRGASSTTFDPGMVVTRWHMALFLTRVLQADGVALE